MPAADPWHEQLRRGGLDLAILATHRGARRFIA
jgi:hypothetical protein